MKLPQTVLKNSAHTSQITQEFSITKTNQMVLFRDTTAVCSENWKIYNIQCYRRWTTCTV